MKKVAMIEAKVHGHGKGMVTEEKSTDDFSKSNRNVPHKVPKKLNAEEDSEMTSVMMNQECNHMLIEMYQMLREQQNELK